jgi:hypothetical protein
MPRNVSCYEPSCITARATLARIPVSGRLNGGPRVCPEQGLSETTLSAPTILDASVRLGVSWKRAKRWIVSPDPAYELKKSTVTA